MEKLLESYSADHPTEVLRVTIGWQDATEELLVFRGVTSSLSRPTPADPTVSIIPPDAPLVSIDRLQAPYNPSTPTYIARYGTWEEFKSCLKV